MIRSMTGYGSAELADAGIAYAVEIRSVNHRYLKLSIRLPERLSFAEPHVDRLLRHRLSRGSVTYSLRVREEQDDLAAGVDRAVLQSYVNQICGVTVPQGVQVTLDLAQVAALPGVCVPPETDDAARQRYLAAIEQVTARALDSLMTMRTEEGKALRADMLDACGQVRGLLDGIREASPRVVLEYQDRLRDRVQQLLSNGGYKLEEDGLMREVAIFAERCDISEELARLSSHLDQFRQLCDRPEEVGRTLDFLAQELLREANTIAAKSNDGQIARSIIEVKALIDRLKEQVQNVE